MSKNKTKLRPKLSSRNRSTIEIDNDLKEMLRSIGNKSESFSAIIRRLLTY